MSSKKLSPKKLSPQDRIKKLTFVDTTQLVDPRVPLRRYYRSANEMLRMAKMYASEGQSENAFVLYYKFITLFVEEIPKHPEYCDFDVKEKNKIKKHLTDVFPVAEKLKIELLTQYKLEMMSLSQDEEKNTKIPQVTKAKMAEESSTLWKEKEAVDPTVSMSKQESFSIKSVKVGSECFEPSNDNKVNTISETVSSNNKSNPTLSSSGNLVCDTTMPSYVPSYTIYPDVWPRDSPISPPPEERSTLNESAIPVIPTVDRRTKPQYLLSPGTDTVYYHGLRIVVLPNDLIDIFLRHAESDYKRNIETCGILTGKLVKNELVITHLVIPHQTGAVDSCSADDETEIFDYQEKHNLLTIGWIHTHPTQSAFLSSVDLHTQCAYQLTMPEAVAIVCSIKDNENRPYTLTDYGLDFITGCRESGFHAHDNYEELYNDSPHLKIEGSLLVIADLRNGTVIKNK